MMSKNDFVPRGRLRRHDWDAAFSTLSLFMNSIFDLIKKVFEWALFLALIGGLGEATHTMYTEAGHARAQREAILSNGEAQAVAVNNVENIE
jgi:hypothetical protein